MSKLFEEVLKSSQNWEDLVVEFCKLYIEAKKQIKRINVYYAVDGKPFEFLERDGPQKIQESFNLRNEIVDAIEEINNLANKVKNYKKRIFQEILKKRPPKWQNPEKKLFVIQILKDADDWISLVEGILKAIKGLKNNKNELYNLLKNYGLLDDEDFK
jgi:hypothetical protein